MKKNIGIWNLLIEIYLPLQRKRNPFPLEETDFLCE